MVVDWGLAKVLQRGGIDDELRAEAASEQTVIETVRSGPGSGSDSVVGSVLGTPAYMPPEQAMGEVVKVDERSDVFSLGAILCEILTGKAPYVDDDRLRVVEMAAHGEIDPARERIEASGADPELAKLCIGCLAPSRAARPRNAESLAKRIHEFLSSTEQRARDAELAAREAGVRVVEERRRRRLTAALAGTIVLALVGGGWGYLSVQASRAGRIEEARTALDEARDEVRTLHSQGRHSEAVDVANAAMRIAETVDVEDALAQRAKRMVADAQAELDHAEQLEAVARRNQALADRFEAIRVRYDVPVDGASDAYHAAFLEYGIDMGAEDLSRALEAMLQSGIEDEFALALDDWARNRLRYSDDDPYLAERLLHVAIDLDPHPVRREVRESILAEDVDALVELSRSPRAAELGPYGLWMLSVSMLDLNRLEEGWATLAQAVEAHPENALLHMATSEEADLRGNDRLALQHAIAARSLRPDNVFACKKVGSCAMEWGDRATAARAYRRALELAPDDKGSQWGLVWSLYRLGQMEAAADLRKLDGTRVVEDYKGQDLLVGYLTGRVERENMIEIMEQRRVTHEGLNLWWAFVLHPRTSDADLEHVAEIIEEAAPQRSGGRWTSWIACAIAYLRLERWEDAMRAVETAAPFTHAGDEEDSVFMDSIRAAAHAGLGDLDEARVWLERAEQHHEAITSTHPGDWMPEAPMNVTLRMARERIGD